MPKEKTPGKPSTRRYSEQERLSAVRMCRQLEMELGTSHGVVKRVADQLGYGVESVRKWWRDADVTEGLAGPDAQRVVELESELKDANQELRELRRANEILRKASAYFAQAELDRPQR
jgi:transposase